MAGALGAATLDERLAKWKPVEMPYRSAALSAREKQMVEKLVEATGMGILNHIGGALLGFAKGVLIMSAILYLIALADPKETMISQPAKQKSMFYRPVAAVVPLLLKWTGKNLKISYSPHKAQ